MLKNRERENTKELRKENRDHSFRHAHDILTFLVQFIELYTRDGTISEAFDTALLRVIITSNPAKKITLSPGQLQHFVVVVKADNQ